MTEENFSHLVIEGPIGVGKTSLAKRLAKSFDAELLLESAAENPFLERFYRNQRQAALATQLFFLFQRQHQLSDIRQSNLFCSSRISDFLIEKDRLFAKLTLDDNELKIYEQVYEASAQETQKPDLVIYLQAPTEILLQRIRHRGRNFEQNIDGAYLRRLIEAYAQFFHHYTDAPLLIVNAAQVDFVNNNNDYNTLLEQIKNIKFGRHFFNPLPMAL